MKILLADDHAVVRRGLRQILAEAFEGGAFGEASTADEVLNLVQRHAWDLLLLDISMPGRSGLAILRDIRQLRPRLPVLILSIHSEDQYAKRVLQAGANGYLTKNSAPGELVGAVQAVLRGGTYVSPALAQQLASDLRDGKDKPLTERLSNRELEVLSLIGSGRSLKEIAAELKLSPKTVGTYRVRLSEKLGKPSIGALMRFALEQDLTR